MKTISVKALRPVKMTAKTLIFEDPNHGVYMASRRVANDILSNKVEEVFIVDEVFPKGHCEAISLPMLATPSCW
jgi:hypothetical protein